MPNHRVLAVPIFALLTASSRRRRNLNLSVLNAFPTEQEIGDDKEKAKK
jgi:hypothetical protein